MSTLEWVHPLTFAVGNVLSNVFKVGVFVKMGEEVSIQAKLGVAISICGVVVYSIVKAFCKERKSV